MRKTREWSVQQNFQLDKFIFSAWKSTKTRNEIIKRWKEVMTMTRTTSTLRPATSCVSCHHDNRLTGLRLALLSAICCCDDVYAAKRGSGLAGGCSFSCCRIGKVFRRAYGSIFKKVIFLSFIPHNSNVPISEIFLEYFLFKSQCSNFAVNIFLLPICFDIANTLNYSWKILHLARHQTKKQKEKKTYSKAD